MRTVAYLGGGALGDAPPLWPEHKNFLNTLNQKLFFKFLVRGHSPLPRPLLQWGGDTPFHTPPHWRLRRLEPRVFGSAPPSQNPKYATVCGANAMELPGVRPSPSVPSCISSHLISSHLLFFKNSCQTQMCVQSHTHMHTIKCFGDKCIDVLV